MKSRFALTIFALSLTLGCGAETDATRSTVATPAVTHTAVTATPPPLDTHTAQLLREDAERFQRFTASLGNLPPAVQTVVVEEEMPSGCGHSCTPQRCRCRH